MHSHSLVQKGAKIININEVKKNLPTVIIAYGSRAQVDHNKCIACSWNSAAQRREGLDLKPVHDVVHARI
jgi:hypothetical protein